MSSHPLEAPLSVSELTALIKDNLESTFFYCVVEGEISTIAFPASGHVYLTLKDDSAVLKAVLWRGQAQKYFAYLKQGEKIEARGSLSLYLPRGEYQLVINHLAPQGEGRLYAQFKALQAKLAKEGLFNTVHKKTIKKHPHVIGLITSETGAALQDVHKTLSLHRPDISTILYPTLVQGERAPHAIVEAINKANQEGKADTLLLVRGGGSLEDLWAFNDEGVARAIFSSVIPIITGIGHETDTTIADLVADLRAETPTMAAKLVAISKEELYQTLDMFFLKLEQQIQLKISTLIQQVGTYELKIKAYHPHSQLGAMNIRLGYLDQRLKAAITLQKKTWQSRLLNLESQLSLLSLKQKRATLLERTHYLETQLIKGMEAHYKTYGYGLSSLVTRLNALSPLAIFKRGYSLVEKFYEDKREKLEIQERAKPLVSSIGMVTRGEKLKIHLSDGYIIAQVEEAQKRAK